MVTYFISPYNPPQWVGTSELKIVPDIYSELLKKHWLDITIFRGSTDEHHLLRWEIPSRRLEGQLMGEATDYGQVVSFSGSASDVVEFALWHRSVMLQEHVLYFFSEGLGVRLKLEGSYKEMETSLQKALEVA